MFYDINMSTYFEVIKLLFFIFTFLIILYQLRLHWILPDSIVNVIWPFVMPFYLILVGLIIGYVVGYILTQKRWKSEEEKSYLQWFIIWWVIGIILAWVYYFILPQFMF